MLEEWTYPAAVATAKPIGVKMVPVKVDGQGMSAVDLEHVLSTWSEQTQGRRLHLFFNNNILDLPVLDLVSCIQYLQAKTQLEW